jgi:precorrin-3B synthase
VPARRQTADDACPGALRLHAAADGPLARVRLPGGVITGAQLRVLAEIAGEHGDAALELTSRANIQLRALRAAPAELAGRLAAAGLLPSLAHETVRNIAAPPLADATTRRLVDDLDRALCGDDALAGLPGRFLFAVGRTASAADVAAVPAGPREWAIVLAGEDAGVRVDADQVVAAMLRAAHGFLDARAGREPRPWRLREIPGGAELVAARLPGRRTAARLPGGPASPPGPLVGLIDGTAVGALVPLRRLTGVQLEVLGRAERLAVVPDGGVVVLDLEPETAVRWRRELTAAGLITERDSKWVGVTACAGRPGCAKALADVRRDAAEAARFVDGRPVHWVGCERGCGSPATPHVRVEATASGYLVDGAPVASAGLAEAVAVRRA